MKNNILHLTVRVYGLLCNEQSELLICQEQIQDHTINKFPGGGLELGESPPETLLREMKEETNLICHIERHIYTTDFYIESIFRPHTQVLCIYYLLACDDLSPLKLLPHNAKLIPRFVEINTLNTDFFSFESDRRAFEAFRMLHIPLMQ